MWCTPLKDSGDYALHILHKDFESSQVQNAFYRSNADFTEQKWLDKFDAKGE